MSKSNEVHLHFSGFTVHAPRANWFNVTAYRTDEGQPALGIGTCSTLPSFEVEVPLDRRGMERLWSQLHQMLTEEGATTEGLLQRAALHAELSDVTREMRTPVEGGVPSGRWMELTQKRNALRDQLEALGSEGEG